MAASPTVQDVRASEVNRNSMKQIKFSFDSDSFLKVLILAAAVAWLAFAVSGASTGLFLIDELIYQGMIDAFARHGALAVDNGYSEFPSESLKLIMLVESSGQLFPQYPSGWAMMAAPAYGLAGLRGILMLNALAATATLFLLWVGTRALLANSRLASVATLLYATATFAVDYAFGIWPHAISTCLVTAAFAAGAIGWRSGGKRELPAMLTAGIAVGIAVNIRADAILAVPAIGLWVLGTYRRPFIAMAALGASLAPGLLVAGALNLQKFGVLSPVSYGRQGVSAGATSIDYYGPLIPLVTILAIGALLLGFKPVRALVLRPAALAVAGGLLILSAVLVPEAWGLLRRLLIGLYVLLVDMQAYSGASLDGIEFMGDGTLRVWGLAKKSLLQSVPYLAGVLVLVRPLVAGARGAPLWYCLIFCVIWVLPFAFGQWHGGLSNNLRYFAPILPAISVLSVAAWYEHASTSTNWKIAIASAFVALIVASIPPHLAGFAQHFIWQVSVPGVLAGVLAMASIALQLPWVRNRWLIPAVSVWRGVFLLCIAMACMSTYWFDLSVNQERRARNSETAALFADLPSNSLVVSFSPELAGFRLNAAPRMTSQANWRKLTFDENLVAFAFESGRRVFVQGRFLADAALRSGVAVVAVPRYGIEEDVDLFELKKRTNPTVEGVVHESAN